jgi:MarR family transcriptional regulator for hemolysin
VTKKELPLPNTSLPDDYRLRNRLGYRLSRLSRIMQAKLEHELAPHGMNRLKWCALSGVGLEGQASPSDLATHIGITRPATSRLLKAMEKEGLIARALTPQDGRAREIQVTDLGRSKLAVCWPLVNRNNSHFVSKLATDDLAGLFQALDQLMGGEVAELDDF